MICSDQKAISDWTLNTSSNIKNSEKEDPIYDCVINPTSMGSGNDARRPKRPSKNEHYYSSTPDELDDDCPEAALTEKTAFYIRRPRPQLPPPIPPKPLASEELSFTIKMARLRHDQQSQNEDNVVAEEGHFRNEASDLQMNLDNLNKLNLMKSDSSYYDDQNTLYAIFIP